MYEPKKCLKRSTATHSLSGVIAQTLRLPLSLESFQTVLRFSACGSGLFQANKDFLYFVWIESAETISTFSRWTKQTVFTSDLSE